MLQEVGSLFKKNEHINNVISIIPRYNPLSNTARSTPYCELKNQSLFVIFLIPYKNKLPYNMEQTNSKYLNLNRRYRKYKSRGHLCDIRNTKIQK